MGTILAYIKSFNTIVSLIKGLLEWIKDAKLRKIEDHFRQRNEAVSRINEKIKAEASKEKPSDEAIKDLHRRLNNISGKL